MPFTDTTGNPKQATNCYNTKQCEAPLSTRTAAAVGCYMPVLAMGFPDLDPAHAITIPREWVGFTKSYNPAGLLGNYRELT